MKPLQKGVTLLIVSILVLAHLSRAAADPSERRIVLATLDWPPYVGQDLPDQGYIAVIVKEAFRRSHIDVDLRFHRWSRVIGLAQKGEVDGYFPEYYADSIQKWARFSTPIPAGPLGFFKRKTSEIAFTCLRDLAPYRIGIVKGYINSAEFDAADFLNKHPVKDDLSNFRLLQAGRVDLVVADRYVGRYLVKEHLPNLLPDLVFLPRILEEKRVYVCIRTGKKNTGLFLNAVNRGLQQMGNDGTLDRLLPPGDIPHP